MPEVNTAGESQQPKHETERKGFAEKLLSPPFTDVLLPLDMDTGFVCSQCLVVK